jgi:hypothetical protein
MANVCRILSNDAGEARMVYICNYTKEIYLLGAAWHGSKLALLNKM